MVIAVAGKVGIEEETREEIKEEVEQPALVEEGISYSQGVSLFSLRYWLW